MTKGAAKSSFVSYFIINCNCLFFYICLLTIELTTHHLVLEFLTNSIFLFHVIFITPSFLSHLFTVLFSVSSTMPTHAVSLPRHPLPSPTLFFVFAQFQPWRTTVSRWCSSRNGWFASHWPTLACPMRADTSASSTRIPRTTRWRHSRSWFPQRHPQWRWSRRLWRAVRRNSPVCHHAASRPPPCDGCVKDGR